MGAVSIEGNVGMMTYFISWRNILAQMGGIISASLLIIPIRGDNVGKLNASITIATSRDIND